MPNVYDFDKTIAHADSGFVFFGFCLRRHFFKMLRHLPRLAVECIRFAINRKRGRPVRGDFYIFLPSLPNWQEEVRIFWEEKADDLMQPWYLAQKRPDDIIISCTADFLLRPLCNQLGVRLLGTNVCLEKYRLQGESCYGPEKVRRLREEYGDIEINEFYSDSLSDAPLAKLAKKAFLVKGDALLPWPMP